MVSKSISDIYESQEKLNAFQNMERVQRAMLREVEELRRQTWDYATWDEAYAFVQNPDPAFIAEHLDDAAFHQFQIHGAFYFDCGGKPIWGKVLDPNTGQETVMLDFLITARDSLDFSLGCPTDVQDGIPYKGPQGIYLTSRGPVMLAWQPVVTSLYKGPPRGTHLMVRFVTDAVVQDVAKQTRINFTATAVDQLPPAERKRADVLWKEKRIETEAASNTELHTYGVLNDVAGKPVLLLKLTLPRPLLNTVDTTKRLLIASVLIVGGILILLAYYTSARLIARPLNQMSERLDDMIARGDFSEKFPETRRDEFVRLRQSINNLISRLSDKTG